MINDSDLLVYFCTNYNSYRKALRMMYYADHHGLPIITFVDTPGAFADLKSEELGQVCALFEIKHQMFHFREVKAQCLLPYNSATLMVYLCTCRVRP